MCLGIILSFNLKAQIDSTLLKKTTDSSKVSMNMDAVYNRPFLQAGKLPISLGGYAEVNYQHMGTDGISAGHQFQFRRLTLFTASSISKRIKFLAEIEFEPEDSHLEIALEFASVDLEFHPLLNLRGGLILNPIGAFNQNHDGPKWEFTDRPIAMTKMLPATWTNTGFGLYGKQFAGKWMFGYEAYLSGGFDGSIIDNEENRTFLPESKENTGRLLESASGEPMFTGKISMRNVSIGELGISYMGGVYNQYQVDGLSVDEARRLDVIALDFNTTIPGLNTNLITEWAWVFVETPANYIENFGSRQQGGFADLIQPVVKRKILGWDNAVLNLAVRGEYVDWNKGNFNATGTNIGDDCWSIMPGISFRPTSRSVLRFNYRYMEERDLMGNPPALTGGFNFGISTYF